MKINNLASISQCAGKFPLRQEIDSTSPKNIEVKNTEIAREYSPKNGFNLNDAIKKCNQASSYERFMIACAIQDCITIPLCSDLPYFGWTMRLYIRTEKLFRFCKVSKSSVKIECLQYLSNSGIFFGWYGEARRWETSFYLERTCWWISKLYSFETYTSIINVNQIPQRLINWHNSL